MSVARILIKQGEVIYRFLKFEARPDGSLLVFLDRDPSPLRGAMNLREDGLFVPDDDASEGMAPHAKISCHTTGEIHYYSGGVIKNIFHIEPLHTLTSRSSVAFFSLPRVPRLDRFESRVHHHDIAATFDIPPEIAERMTFVLELAPAAPVELETYGISLNYEVYSAIIRLVPNPAVSPEMVDHIIHGVPRVGQFNQRQIDKANAELGFHHRVHGRTNIVFREDSGAYIVLAAVPMRIAPLLTITFDRDDLRIEPIPFGQIQEPTHKVRFWIADRGGRNKKDDLRNHITSIELNARLPLSN